MKPTKLCGVHSWAPPLPPGGVGVPPSELNPWFHHLQQLKPNSLRRQRNQHPLGQLIQGNETPGIQEQGYAFLPAARFTVRGLSNFPTSLGCHLFLSRSSTVPGPVVSLPSPVHLPRTSEAKQRGRKNLSMDRPTNHPPLTTSSSRPFISLKSRVLKGISRKGAISFFPHHKN